jgi:hypothetical protein
LRLLPKGNFTTLNRKVLVSKATSKGRSLCRECLLMLFAELCGKSAFDNSENGTLSFCAERLPSSVKPIDYKTDMAFQHIFNKENFQ